MGKIAQIEKSPCPPHEFKPVKYQEQEAVTTYYSNQTHLVTTLVHERVRLYCVKCGEVKSMKAGLLKQQKGAKQ